MYEIQFNSKNSRTGFQNSAKGTIYISSDTYAIHRLEYKGFGINKVHPVYSIKIEYLLKEGLMFLNYISFSNQFIVKSKNDFRIKDIAFNTSENAFYITFNNEIKKTSIENKKNYHFSYKYKKLNISKITLKEPTVIKLTLAKNELLNIDNLDGKTINQFKYRIKNIRDKANRKLNKTTLIKTNQLRELFVQEVFPNRRLNSNYFFVRKEVNLSESIINRNDKMKKYWINSPLKTIKE